MRELTIGKNDAGQRVDRFVSKALPLLPPALLQKYIRLKRIKVNGGRAQRDQRLQEGDMLQLYINDEFFDKPNEENLFLTVFKPQLNIVYEDDNLLLVDKRPGLSVHADETEKVNTLINHIQAYLYQKREWNPKWENAFAPALCNRIDRNTGGLVIAAKTAPALREITALIRERKIEKFYLTVTEGIPPKAADTLTAYLHKDEKKNKVTLYDAPAPDRMACKTGYRVLDTKANRALLEVELFTGRTHQIRAQLAGIGCPLAGDGKYGNTHGRYRQALLSYKLIFHVPADYTIAHLDGKVFTADTRPITQIFTGDDSNER